MWSPDGQSIYYVTESVARLPTSSFKIGTRKPHHERSRVTRTRRAQVPSVPTASGSLTSAAQNSGSFPLRMGNRKLAIAVHADDKSNTERTVTSPVTFLNSQFHRTKSRSLSSYMARFSFARLRRQGEATYRNPGFDHGIAWAPDGKSSLPSDRSGHEDIYSLEPNDP